MTEMSGGEATVESLRSAEVNVAFGVVGSSFIDILDIIRQTDIKYFGTRHEQSAAHMADSYARVTGKIGVCLAQNGPGATNLVTGIATAYRAGSPVLAITGAPQSTQLLTDAYQEADHVSIFKPITKFSAQVNRADRIPELLRQAFRISLSHRRGPAHIDIPRDFFYELVDVDIWPKEAYCPYNLGTVSNTAVTRVAELLMSSNKPVIVAGGGVVWADATAEVVKLAEMLTIPVATSHGHNDAVPADHPLSVGSIGRGGSRAAMELVAEADLILAAATRLGHLTALPYYGFSFLKKQSRIVQIDIDPKEIGRNFPVTLGIVADIREFLRSLISILSTKMMVSRKDRLTEIVTVKSKWLNEREEEGRSDSVPIKPQRVYRELREVLQKNAIVTLDVGSLPGFGYGLLDFYEARTFIAPLSFGPVGFAYPAALGAKVARPSSPVICVMGDGAFTMSLHEILTAVQYDLPVVAIVMNNFAWGAEKAYQKYIYHGNYIGTDLLNPNLAEVADSLGGRGERIEKPEQIKPSLMRAFQDDKPYVIEILVDPEVLSTPARMADGAVKEPLRRIYPF